MLFNVFFPKRYPFCCSINCLSQEKMQVAYIETKIPFSHYHISGMFWLLKFFLQSFANVVQSGVHRNLPGGGD